MPYSEYSADCRYAALRTVAGAIILLTICGGCTAPGLLYTRVVYPYTGNFTDTTIGTKVCRVTDHQLQVPVSGQNISALWSLNHVRQSLEEAGITRISYIDRETLSFFRGFYRRRELIIYGD